MDEQVDKTIMVVEDEDELRELLVETLQENGYKTIEATNGQECLDMLDRTAPDLIILDVVMPQKDGIEVLNLLMDHVKKRIPVVVLTNKGDFRTTHTAFNFGATKFLVKSDTSMDFIVDTVDEILFPDDAGFEIDVSDSI